MEAMVNPLQQDTVSNHAVDVQLQRLLGSSLFNHSRRYPNFLRYVVNEALQGHQSQLKERSIGVDVFGRLPDYDLNLDPVVRVTAGEVRKRLAQYYYEPEHQGEMRIELHPGSYIPEFKPAPNRPTEVRQIADRPSESLATDLGPDAEKSFPSVEVLSSAELVPSADERRSFVPAQVAESKRHWTRGRLSLVLGCVLLTAFASTYIVRTPSPLRRFWEPVWSNPAPVLITVGSWATPATIASDISIGSHAKTSDPVALADTVTIAGLQQMLSQHAKTTLVQSSTQTSFSDLQHGTNILISAFDNPWTMRLTDPLRFHFVAHSQDVLAIEDRQNPSRSDWQIDTKTPYSTMTRDFGIVARFHDSTTEQNIVIVAGIGENGTIAAGELLTSEQFFDTAARGTGLGGKYRNVEAVVETRVIDGKSGPPRVVAIHFW